MVAAGLAALGLLPAGLPAGEALTGARRPGAGVRSSGASAANALGAAALWDRFVGHLRAGRFPEAYACFSPRSREVFSYESFTNHYHPLTAGYEATLSPVDEGQMQVQGDLAQLRFVAARRSAGTERGVLVTALMVREAGQWFLVAAAREQAARAEAAARHLLPRLWSSGRVREARAKGVTLAPDELCKARALQTNEGLLCLQRYAFALERAGETCRLRARALDERLRTYEIGPEGSVRPVEADRSGAMATLQGPAAARPSNEVRDLPPMPVDREQVRGPAAGAPVSPAPKTPHAAATDRSAMPEDLRRFSLPPLPAKEPADEPRPRKLVVPVPPLAPAGTAATRQGEAPVEDGAAGLTAPLAEGGAPLAPVNDATGEERAADPLPPAPPDRGDPAAAAAQGAAGGERR